MICFTEVNEFIVNSGVVFFFHFGHLYLQGNKGLHSVGDCFP